MLQLAIWVHDLDPYIIQLWEGGPIRWYGFAYLFGFTLAFALLVDFLFLPPLLLLVDRGHRSIIAPVAEAAE